MPYITRSARDWVDAGKPPFTAGELNYKISRLAEDYIAEQGGLSYHSLNEVLGVLECVKLELYRRLAAPYEDDKIAQNGDVFVLAEGRKHDEETRV